ncbi:CpaD family pilus assembly protein [Caulobacter sp. S45]|uniref:CpaD family pilus assembly protein n=1 Tax=Caulobacter sp. S45 TaxID=1641861 RepID=UPI00131C73E4|nr:CpaD family pilus assembly protein [Caulobacter sp. S45]
MSSSDPMRRSLLALASILTLAAGLDGCATKRDAILADQPPAVTPTEQYALKVTTAPEQIAIGLHAEGLSPNQQSALAQFVSEWRDNGGGDVVVRTPSDAPAILLTKKIADQISAYLQHLGVPSDHVQASAYVAGPDATQAPVLVSYDRFEATGPRCANRWDSLMAHFDNQAYAAFGCSVTANMGAQIANPRDLIAPAVVTPADNSRRAVVLGKYRNGLVTSTTSDDQASGKVSAATSQ